MAERELNEAAQYYDRESPGLGVGFLIEVERCIALIIDHPEAGGAVLGGVRRRLLRRFPYGILYSLKPDRIRVLAVMSLSRRPAYWVDRE